MSGESIIDRSTKEKGGPSMSSSAHLSSVFFSKFADVGFLKSVLTVVLHENVLAPVHKDAIIDFVNSIESKIKTGSVIPNAKPTFVLTVLKMIRSTVKAKMSINETTVTYNNVRDAFSDLIRKDAAIDSFIQSVLESRITLQDEYHTELDKVLETIRIYNELKAMVSSLKEFDEFTGKTDKMSIMEMMIEYRNIISKAYYDLDKLKTVKNNEMLSDYFVLYPENKYKEEITSRLKKFFSSGYTYFRAGYDIIDANIGGIESSTVHIISGPTNHGKSIFMTNLLYRFVINSEPDTENDAVVFITLEDDIYKLLKRIYSIFGNIDSKVVRSVFAGLARTPVPSDDFDDEVSVFDEAVGLLYDMSIGKLKGKMKVILKHSNECSFSPADVVKFLDELKARGINVRALFIDYIDVMIPTGGNVQNEYLAQGLIVQELRVLARNNKLPVITITQNRRISESEIVGMDNTHVGDSYKKVRYTDYMYMVRQNPKIDFTSDQVANDIGMKNKMIDIVKLNDILSFAIPFEVKITKSKDGAKDVSRYFIFNTRNLRIYESFYEFKNDLTQMENNSKNISKFIGRIDMVKHRNSSFDFDELSIPVH